MQKKLVLLKSMLGWVVLGLVFLGAAINVAINQLQVQPLGSDEVRLRICHWHLEAVDGFDRVIRGFQEEYFKQTGRRVVIEQVPVPYTGYAQFINTGLIGRMAPDIIQLGCSGQLNDVNTIVRYFVPLGEYVRQPNPYNAGTSLAGMPWRDTFIDALRGNMQQELQEHYSIPLSTQTTRVFYNRELLRRITGGTDFPVSYTGFLELCRQVATWREGDGGEPISPIAACYFQEGMFSDTYREAFLHDLTQRCDFNFDGMADELETAGRYGELWGFDSPPFLHAGECFQNVARHFMPGWTAAGRDDMMFAFVQQRALMTLTFGYDVKMIRDQVAGAFDLGIAQVPLPLDHPEYGRLVKGPRSEVGLPGGNPLAVTRESPHFDVCLAFLRYATSPGPNTEFNAATLWLPMVRTAQLSQAFLEPFVPVAEGYTGQFKHGGEWGGQNPQFRVLASGYAREFSSGKLTPHEYAAKLKNAYETLQTRGNTEILDGRQRMIRGFDRVNAALTFLAFADSESEQADSAARLPALNASIQKQLFEYHVHRTKLGDSAP